MNVESATWLKRFKIPEEEQRNWEKDKASESLLAYGLRHKIVPREEYFDWARESYQLPFLKTEFFQNYVISQNKWRRIKDLETWSRCRLPVWCWEDIVYIGCIEPYEKTPQFLHRFVLATDISLKMLWKNFQEGEEVTKSFSLRIKKSENQLSSKSSLKQSIQSFTQEVPQKTPDGFKRDDKSNKSNQTDKLLSNEKVLAMEDYKNREKTEAPINTQTGVYKLKEDNKLYVKLWEKAKTHFSSMIVFKREDRILSPLGYMGRLSLNVEEFKIDLGDNSLFSILTKNFPYHGPVVGTKTNKEIFKNIGWDILPKHASAISLTTANGEQRVFFGIGSRQISMNEIGEITDLIENFFKQEDEEALKKAS